jgi:hypothetical protein
MSPTVQQRVRAIPAFLRVLILGGLVPAGTALGIYWWVTYAGLYRWLVEGQIALISRYLPVETGILTVVLTGFFPALALLFGLVWLRVFPVKPEDVPPGIPEAAPATPAGDQWLERHKGRVVGFTLGVIGLIAGAVLLVMGLTAGSLQPLDVAELEAGKPPPSGHVRTRGRLLADRALSQSDGGLSTFYLPLVSERWGEGAPIAVYVSGTQAHLEEAQRGRLEGMLSKNGLPGPIRTRFEQSATARPAQPHYLLALGHKPQTHVEVGLFLLGVGGLSFLTALAVSYVKSRRRQAE